VVRPQVEERQVRRLSHRGGEHADFPLGQLHGETIAEIVATSNTPAIIDTSLMKVGERTGFITDFASVHLFIDEAHLMAPQGRVSDPQSGAMLHAANNLVSLGRARGLRIPHHAAVPSPNPRDRPCRLMGKTITPMLDSDEMRLR
jgi:hypothetical protein